MRPKTIVMRATLAAILGVAPVLVLAGPAAAASPVAVDDAHRFDEDTVLLGASVLVNDTDPDGDPLAALEVSQPTNGTLDLATDGTFVYTPDADFSGFDSFTYRASDGSTAGNTATVTINVEAIYDPAVGVPDFYSMPGDTTLDVPDPGLHANDTNPDGATLLSAGNTMPSHGTVSISMLGGFTYTPTPGFRGTDTFSYSMWDSMQLAPSTLVTITVTDHPPVAVDDAYTLDEDTTLTATSVLANDTDANGDPLSAVRGSGPSNGTLTLAAGGTFVYMPDANFNGVDSFTYQASDGNAMSAPTTVTLSVFARIDRPDFDPSILALSAVEDTPYTGQVTANNVDGRPLTYTATTTGTPTGSVVMDPVTGAFTFTPERDFVGLAQLDVFACDTFGYCASLLANITVNDVPDAPVANDQTAATSQGAAVTAMFDVWDIDSQVLTFTVTSAPQRGTVAIDADMWTFVYTPAAGTSGVDSFVVNVCDADGLCISSTVSVAVAPLVGGPVATPLPTLPTPAAPVVAPVAAPVVGAAAGSGADALPVTGADVGALALGALGMVGLGGLLVARSTRRRAQG